MSQQVWVNGQPINTLSVNDRGLSYGDGLFTTMLVANGQPCLLDKHLVRLQQGISTLAIAQVHFGDLIEQVCAIAKDLQNGIIKVIITRGEGKRGYSSIGCDSPTVIVSATPLSTNYQQLRDKGISVGVSTVPLGINPLTAGLKHLNRLEQVLVRQQIDQSGWDDAIVLDCLGFVVESNLANIFWVNDGALYTPSTEFAGVSGVMRECVIEVAKDLGLKVCIDRYRLGSATQASELFITNSLMQIVPIVKVEETGYPIGPVTKQLSDSVVIGVKSE